MKYNTLKASKDDKKKNKPTKKQVKRALKYSDGMPIKEQSIRVKKKNGARAVGEISEEMAQSFAMGSLMGKGLKKAMKTVKKK